MIGKCVRRSGVAGMLLLAAMSGPAWADSFCSGSMNGSSMEPLPKPLTVSVVQPISDDANPALAQQFLNGVQAGGITVVAPNQGNTQLDMTFTVTPPAGATGGVFKGFSWMSGLQAPGGANGALANSVVSVSIEATNISDQSLAWIGTVKCTVHSTDASGLAEHFGVLVARALGKSMTQQSF
jgi:hypothetical protein